MPSKVQIVIRAQKSVDYLIDELEHGRLDGDKLKRWVELLNHAPYHLVAAVAKERSDEPRAPTGMVILSSKVMATAWANILEKNIPPETDETMIKTFKRFFYSGGHELLRRLLGVMDDGDDLTANDMNRIDAIEHEIKAYFAEVAAGRQ